MLSLFLAFVTYGFARSSVVQQRENAAFDQARNNAQIVNGALGGSADVAIQRLEDIGVQRPLLWYNDQWTSGRAAGFDQSEVPQQLQEKVIEDGEPAYMRVQVGDELNIVVGHPLPGRNAYFQFFSLDEVTDTLQSVRLSLILGTIITTALGVLAGQFAGRPPRSVPWGWRPRPPRRSPVDGSTPGSNPPRIPT